MRLALLAAGVASVAHAAPLNLGSFFSTNWGSSSSSSQGAAVKSTKQADATTTTGMSFYSGNVTTPALFVYSNSASDPPPDPTTLGGFGYYAMTFWTSEGTTLNAAAWEAMSQADQQSTHQAYHSAGVLLLISAFGSSETPVTTGADPTDTANQLATWVMANNCDGVDIDFEDFAAMRAGTGVAWVNTFQTALRTALGTSYFISHAPIAPWFSTDSSYFGGGYLAVDKAVGSTIDLYLVQFYNQDQYYNTCAEIVTGGGDSEAYWPGSALNEIIASGISSSKLLIGKPVSADDATSGFTDLATLATCITQAKQTGWNAGVMAWAWPEAGTTNFLQTVWPSS